MKEDRSFFAAMATLLLLFLTLSLSFAVKDAYLWEKTNTSLGLTIFIMVVVYLFAAFVPFTTPKSRV